jgi:hypothetical protein
MSQNTTFKFQEKRSGEVLNRRWRDILPPGKYKGFFVTANGANLILSISTTDPDTLVDFETNVLLTPEGVRVEETTNLNGIIVLAPADPTLARIDRIVTKHRFDPSNAPAEHIALEGTPAATPVPPVIPTGDGFFYTELAQVTIAAAATSVDQGDVVNLGLQTVGLSNVGLADLSDVSAEQAAAFAAMVDPSGVNPIVTQSVLDDALTFADGVIESWKVLATDPASDSVDVGPGRAYDPLLETTNLIASSTVGPFDPVPSGGDVRVDLIVVDQLTQTLVVRQGVVNGAAGAPTSDDYPVARILITETAGNVIIDQSDITDVKPVFWRPDPKVTGLRYGDDTKPSSGLMDAMQAVDEDATNPPSASNPLATIDDVTTSGHGDLTADPTPYHSPQSVIYDPDTIFEALDNGADLVATNLIQDPDAAFETIGVRPGDNLKVTTGTQAAVYEVDAVNSQTELALLNSAGQDPGLSNEVGVSYEIYRVWDTGPENMNQVAGELASRMTAVEVLKPNTLDLGSFGSGTIEIAKQASYVQATVTANGVNVGTPEQLSDGAHMFIAINSDNASPWTITWDPAYSHETGRDQLLGTPSGLDYTLWLIIKRGIALVAIRLNDAESIPVEQGFVFAAGAGQSFVVPGGTTLMTALVWGGGGGGAGRNAVLVNLPGGGGGGAGFIRAVDLPVTPGETLDIDVGAGGAGGAQQINGGAGQQSRVESTTGTVWELISAGGGGGFSGTSPFGGAGGGTTVNGISPGGGWTQENGENGGNAVNGVISGFGGAAGGASFGGGAQAAGVSFGGNGNPGNPFGGGGSGAYEDFNGTFGGTAADGRVILVPQN